MLYLNPFITAYCLVLAFILGAVFASFLACMGWRICSGESLVRGRSHCDVCGHELRAKDLIPIVSFVAGKGHCAYCKSPIAALNLYGELLLAVVFVATTMRFDISPTLILMLFFVCMLFLVSITDIHKQFIPDGCLLITILGKVLYIVIEKGFSFEMLKALGTAVLDGLIVAVPLLLLVLLMEKLWKKEAMGGGDIKLIFVTGIYLGWACNLLGIFFACIIGIAVGVLQMRKGDSEENYFPFGPSIAMGSVLSMLWGEQLISAYLSLF